MLLKIKVYFYQLIYNISNEIELTHFFQFSIHKVFYSYLWNPKLESVSVSKVLQRNSFDMHFFLFTTLKLKMSTAVFIINDLQYTASL